MVEKIKKLVPAESRQSTSKEGTARMSVRTTADEKLESARSDVESALAGLSAIIIEKVWGWDEYTPEAQARFRKAFAALLEAQANIGVG